MANWERTRIVLSRESEGILFYLEMATRLRTIAARFENVEAKTDLLDIAVKFERLARHASGSARRPR